MKSLLIHADRAPEFIEHDPCIRIKTTTTSSKDVVTYEMMGKIRVYLTEYDETPGVVSEMRAFAHPEIMEGIKTGGMVRRLPEPWEGA